MSLIFIKIIKLIWYCIVYYNVYNNEQFYLLGVYDLDLVILIMCIREKLMNEHL